MNSKASASDPRELAEKLTVYGTFGMTRALRAAAKRDTRLLSLLLCSRSLNHREQKLLAAYIEGKFRRKRGRPGGIALTPQRIKRSLAAQIVQTVKQDLKESGERYSHKVDVERTLEKLDQLRGWRLTPEDIENELKRPTKLGPTSAKNS